MIAVLAALVLAALVLAALVLAAALVRLATVPRPRHAMTRATARQSRIALRGSTR